MRSHIPIPSVVVMNSVSESRHCSNSSVMLSYMYIYIGENLLYNDFCSIKLIIIIYVHVVLFLAKI